MKRILTLAFCQIAATLGFGLGLAIGWVSLDRWGKTSAARTSPEPAGHLLDNGAAQAEASNSSAAIEEAIARRGADRLRWLAAHLPSIDAAQIAALADAMAADSAETRRAEWDVILFAWTQLDPDAALTFAEDSTGAREANLRAVFSAWAGADAVAALAAADDYGGMRRVVGKALIGADPFRAIDVLGNDAAAWVEAARQDPARATALAEEKREGYEAVASALAEIDPDSAVAWVRHLGGSRSQDLGRIFGCVLESLARRDPEKAIQLANDGSLTDQERSRAIAAITRIWAAQDYVAANASAENVKGDANLVAILQSLSAEEAAWLAKRAGWNLLSAHQRRVKMWQLETPELLALAEAAKRAAPIDRQNAAFDRDLTDELAKRDLTAAFRLYDSAFPPNELRSPYEYFPVAVKNFDAADRPPLESLERLEGDQRLGAAVAFAWRMGTADPEALDRIAALLPETERSRVQLAATLGGDPDEALAFLERSGVDWEQFCSMPFPLRDRLADADIGRLVELQGASTANSGELRDWLARWTEADPLAASEWVASLPDGADRESLVGRMVQSASNFSYFGDPGGYWEWAKLIPDSPRRRRMVIDLLAQLNIADPAGAEARIEEAPISPADRNRLYRSLQRHLDDQIPPAN